MEVRGWRFGQNHKSMVNLRGMLLQNCDRGSCGASNCWILLGVGALLLWEQRPRIFGALATSAA